MKGEGASIARTDALDGACPATADTAQPMAVGVATRGEVTQREAAARGERDARAAEPSAARDRPPRRPHARDVTASGAAVAEHHRPRAVGPRAHAAHIVRRRLG